VAAPTRRAARSGSLSTAATAARPRSPSEDKS
jgi:hypothetical protein